MRRRCSCGLGAIDETEGHRRFVSAAINRNPEGREALETAYGQVWNTEELRRDFEVLSFMAPYVVVIRLSDSMLGSLLFQHDPRYYFDFTPGER